MSARRSTDRLEEYKRKRDFSATSEPKGRKRAASKRLRFVVQEHRATRLHWDFRLETNGVMASWAVAKGPSMVPLVKRLAIKTEDHPLDYQSFEGVIPEGNYGAGEVIVWDNGTYELAEGDDPDAAIARGKMNIILHGKKLRGLFTLAPGEREEREDPGGASALGTVVKADPIPRHVKPMLATLIDAPFDDERGYYDEDGKLRYAAQRQRPGKRRAGARATGHRARSFREQGLARWQPGWRANFSGEAQTRMARFAGW